MDNGRSNFIEVLKGVDDLHDDGASFLLRHQLVLLQVEVQVVALTILQHRAKPAQRVSGTSATFTDGQQKNSTVARLFQ